MRPLHTFICLALSLGLGAKSMAQSSSSGSAQSMASAGLSIAMSAEVIQKGSSSCPGWGCIMVAAGVLGVLTGVMALKGDSSSNSAVCNDPTDTSCSSAGDFGGQTAGTTGNTPTGGGLTTTGQTPLTTANQALGTLQSLGYGVDPSAGTITTPNGSVLGGGSLGNPAALAAAGMSPDDIAKMNAALAALNDKFKVTSMPIAGGGGGAASGGKVKVEYTDDISAGGKGRMNFAKGTTAGLSRKLAGGDSIGARVDDIFAMIQREYQRKSDERIFVGQ